MFLLAFLPLSFEVHAQQPSDIRIVPKVTNATCESNGEITAEVTSINNLYTIKSVVYTYENEATHSLVSSKDTSQPMVTGLPAGSYTLRVGVLFNNGNRVNATYTGIKVTSSYRMPVISIKEQRPTLKGYNEPTGMIGLRAANGSARNYTVRLLKTPAGYTGYKEFTYSATSDWKYFYNLPAGKYQVQVSDECISYPAVEVEVTTTADSFYSNIGDNDLVPIRDHCGWYRVWSPTTSSFPYYTSLDTIAKYYDFTFVSQETLKNSSSSITWYDMNTIPRTLDNGNVVAYYSEGRYSPLCFKLPDGLSWYKMARKPSQERPRLVYRLKGTDLQSSYELDYFKESSWILHVVDESDGPCADYKRKLYLYDSYRVDFCPPITVTVAEATAPNVILEQIQLGLENKSSDKAILLNTPFSREKSYIFTYRDGNGDEIKNTYPDLLPQIYSSSSTYSDYCMGIVKNSVRIYSLVNVGSSEQHAALDGYTICLKSAPAGYEPPFEHSLQVGKPYKVPTGFGNVDFYPFSIDVLSNPNYPHQNGKSVLLPKGNYIFTVTDPCGRTKDVEVTLLHDATDRYSIGTKELKPMVVVKECGRMRIYPFAGGHTDIILKNGTSYDTPYAYITSYPNGLNSSDVRVFNGSSYYNSYYVQAPESSSSVKPEDIYFDMPLAQGSLKIMTSFKEYSYSCMPTVTVDLENANLSYDRDSYVGYKCPSGTYAYFFIQPKNYVGHLDIEIRPVKGGEPIYKAHDVDVSKGVEVHINRTTANPIQDDAYMLYLKDLKCLNDNKNGTPISLYDLSSTSIVRTTRVKTKYCEGEPITLESVSLGGKVIYKWRFPDGTEQDGRVVTIPTSEAKKHSGKYTLTATNIICEGSPTSITIDFELSVAPPILWWNSKAKNANWFDRNNWLNKEGVSVNAIPAACTTVHIPSEVDHYYPDLDPAISIQGTYGAAECNDVYFHYGSRLGRPQLLRYSRAYVDYNFGKMQMGGTVVAHAEPHFPQSDKQLMARDRWYMLATPLKNILSGDFGLAGYPMTYQRHFKSGIATTSGLSEASFEKPVNSLIENMSSFNHAIALKVAGQSAKVGYNDHKNLNGLNGIIRIPYYLNDAVGAYYPLHKYIPETNTSAFRYYNMETLAPMSKVDRFTRKPEEDFRFVFETGGKKAIGAISVAGTSVEGYAFQLTGDTNSEFRMVGNPFMSAIDFDRLKEVNSTLIEPYYYIFTDNTWKVYYSGVTSPSSTLQKEIAPLQAIVIKKKATGALLFPTAGEKNVLLAPNKQLSVKSHSMTEPSDGIRRVSVIPGNSAGHGAESVLLPDTDLAPAPALFYPAIDEVPTVYFVDTETGTPNVIQSGAYRSIVPMGVHSSVVGTVHLDFSSLTQGLFSRVVLYDRETRREQDLLANPYYSYQNRANEGTRFELRMEYPGVKSVDTPLADGDLLRVSPTETGYRVESAVALKGFSLWAVDGKLLGKSFGIDALEFFVDRAYCQSVVILKVHLADGSTLTRKLPKL